MPIYTHECSNCIFIDTKTFRNIPYDLYYCNQPEQAFVTLIARYGNEKYEYLITIKPIITIPATEALARDIEIHSAFEALCGTTVLE